jgi:hypothetical protein
MPGRREQRSLVVGRPKAQGPLIPSNRDLKRFQEAVGSAAHRTMGAPGERSRE